LVSGHQSRPAPPQDGDGTARLVGHAIVLAASLGVVTTAAVYLFPETILQLYGVKAGGRAPPARASAQSSPIKGRRAIQK